MPVKCVSVDAWERGKWGASLMNTEAKSTFLTIKTHWMQFLSRNDSTLQVLHVPWILPAFQGKSAAEINSLYSDTQQCSNLSQENQSQAWAEGLIAFSSTAVTALHFLKLLSVFALSILMDLSRKEQCQNRSSDYQSYYTVMYNEWLFYVCINSFFFCKGSSSINN